MSKFQILVVEDDAPVRNLIATTLKANDYRFLTAATGESAVMEAASHNPDVVLLDLGLPDLDGVEVIRRIRSWSNVPIIVISARSEDIDKIVRTVLIQKDGKYVINRKFVGHDATYILRESGVQFSGDPVLVIADVDRYHPFVEVEMLMPVLGMVRVNNFDEALDEAFRAEHGCQHSAMIHSSNVHNMSRAARRMNTTIFVKNAPSYSGLGFGGEGYTTLTIATPTGEGLTSAKSFTRARRCVLKGDFRII